MNLAKNLKMLRIYREIKQEKLARDIGVSIQTINKWENAKCIPDVFNLVKLAEYYNVSMEFLINADFDFK
ncbi:TPA: helix-turn-helix transcriptional regulator [Staphylococcus aureus]|uniref:helix-turn-helix domain-containing protein n=1 Tax=Burkholderia multivorans TaxID=87883 RepID=UPI000DAF2CAB|nr:XRE family transcriptional regulator [Burkholderia multivorans]